MSGIVGIVNRDGRPVDVERLRRMTDYLAFRGPDTQETWVDGAVGFGHAMLRTTFEAEHESQPCSLDGEVWITADARIDGRTELLSKLTAKGRTIAGDVTDPELILHAYAVWGSDCVAHLLGDFAFAIWDGRRQQLFCARDHFGVKPFYYAEVSDGLLFSNTLNCLRTHPAVTNELNDLAIADFLMFGFGLDLDTTVFADVRRLPPAHSLIWGKGELRAVVTRYWALTIPPMIRYKRTAEYVERYRELFTTAVADRLRTDRAAVSMSGGMDSTSTAAIAHQLLSARQRPFTLIALTNVTETVPDLEKPFAALMAQHLDIPIYYSLVDGDNVYAEEPRIEAHSPPEPGLLAEASFGGAAKTLEEVGDIRVGFTGFGGDPAHFPAQLNPLEMLRRGYGTLNLLRDQWSYLVIRRRLAPLYLRSSLKLRQDEASRRPPFPPWLQPSLVKSLALEERWQGNVERILYPQLHAKGLNPRAMVDLTGPMWPWVFGTADPEATGQPIETVYPFFDVRLIDYSLALPPIPWSQDKLILRTAMEGTLPEAVRTRPKTPLAGNPARYTALNLKTDEVRIQLRLAPPIARLVDIDLYLRLVDQAQRLKVWEIDMITRPSSLAIWWQWSYAVPN